MIFSPYADNLAAHALRCARDPGAPDCPHAGDGSSTRRAINQRAKITASPSTDSSRADGDGGLRGLPDEGAYAAPPPHPRQSQRAGHAGVRRAPPTCECRPNSRIEAALWIRPRLTRRLTEISRIRARVVAMMRPRVCDSNGNSKAACPLNARTPDRNRPKPIRSARSGR